MTYTVVVNRKLTTPGVAYCWMKTLSTDATSNEAMVPLATRQYRPIDGSSETRKVLEGARINCIAPSGGTSAMIVGPYGIGELFGVGAVASWVVKPVAVCMGQVVSLYLGCDKTTESSAD